MWYIVLEDVKWSVSNHPSKDQQGSGHMFMMDYLDKICVLIWILVIDHKQRNVDY